MAKLISTLSPADPDQNLLRWLKVARHIGLCAVGLLSLASLTVWSIRQLQHAMPTGWQWMNFDSAFCVLCSAASLEMMDRREWVTLRRLAAVLAAMVAVVAIAVLAEALFPVSLGMHLLTEASRSAPAALSPGMPVATAVAFELLAFAVLLLQTHWRIAARTADVLVATLMVLVLALVSEYVFRIIPDLSHEGVSRTSVPTLLCLIVLSQVLLLRCAEQGVFSILLGSGIGSRIARLFSPLVLVLPFLREVGRAHLIQANRLPQNYATGIMASITAMLSFLLVLFMAWRISSMEGEIHNLSLRDELTGLYNLRGFSLLAEQALRLAQRSQMPFSVMFMDMDNLKQINDRHGHSAGSAALCEAGELLHLTFRETDVVGRVGGDEFAVAGQFSAAAIAAATQRLRDLAERRNQTSRRQIPFSFSIGHVTTETGDAISLRILVSRADEAMYEEKRRKQMKRS